MAREPSFGSLGQIARPVSDIAMAEHWYRDVLGLSHLYTFGPLAFFDCGGVRLMLSAEEEGGGASILYFRVSDIGATHRRLAARGIKFTHAPRMIHRHEDGTEEWMDFFEDNESRPLALMSRVSELLPETGTLT